FGFRFALLKDDLGFGLALRADGRGLAFRFKLDALPFRFGQSFNTLALEFGLFENGGGQFALAAQNLRLLYLDLVFLLNLVYGHLFGTHLLLHHVGLNFVRLVGLGLLLFHQLRVFGFLDFKIALRLGLLRKRESFGQDALLIGFGFGDGSF